MYITNADSFVEDVTSIKLPDMTLRTIGFNVLYATDENFSLAAAYKLNARQQRSEISWILMAAGSQVIVDVPGGPARSIPAAAGSVWQEDVSVQAHSGIVGGGVGGSLRIGSFFVAPLLTFGLGAQNLEYASGGETDDTWRVAPQLSARASVGYNGPGFFVAFIASVDSRNIDSSVMNATQTTGLFELIVGRRFDLGMWKRIGTVDPW